jgi:hypothetical protein
MGQWKHFGSAPFVGDLVAVLADTSDVSEIASLRRDLVLK